MKAPIVVLFLTVLIPATVLGETKKHDHMVNGSMHGMMTEGALPQETGQAAFAAIQEIVAMLNADPATDWSTVDIEALRQHLIDMNNVTLGAEVKTQQLGDSIQFRVSGEGVVIESIKRMVVAHAVTMNGVDGWTYVAEPLATGASITVTPPDAASMIKLHALGFIGIMTIGMHHQQHHWMLAKGMQPHQ
jgi:hypothetical protein